MINTTIVTAAIGAIALSTPGFAKAGAHDMHRHHVTHAVEAYTGWSQAPHFIGVGPNGYWRTTSWGCWTDEGQGRIQDCNYGGGP